ncbi:MAG: hypothetical protein V4472_06645 [Pseudomonadota bacterium]
MASAGGRANSVVAAQQNQVNSRVAAGSLKEASKCGLRATDLPVFRGYWRLFYARTMTFLCQSPRRSIESLAKIDGWFNVARNGFGIVP